MGLPLDTGLVTGIRRPGLDGFSSREIRMRVPGGHAVAVTLQAGDELAVTDREGCQPALLAEWTLNSRADKSELLDRSVGRSL